MNAACVFVISPKKVCSHDGFFRFSSTPLGVGTWQEQDDFDRFRNPLYTEQRVWANFSFLLFPTAGR